MAKSINELADLAWAYVEEVLVNGQITITGRNGAQVKELSTDQMMDVIKWMTQVKLKQKHAVDAPEDFAPPNTRGDEDDDDPDPGIPPGLPSP